MTAGRRIASLWSGAKLDFPPLRGVPRTAFVMWVHSRHDRGNETERRMRPTVALPRHMNEQQIENLPIQQLRRYGRNPRTHSKKQIQQIAKSIERFGFTNPVLV